MSHQDIFINNLLYSCVDSRQRGSEQYTVHHSLGYILSGEVQFETGSGIYTSSAGTIGLVRRNQLIKSLKVPPPGGDFRAVNILFDQESLRKYSLEHDIQAGSNYTGHPLRLLAPDPFIQSFFESLLPYFNRPEYLTSSLAALKTNEAIELLLQNDVQWRDFLFDFSEPHKIDLETFMQRHFRFNVSPAHFAQLTGRSLAGFKRDFEKIFQTSPGRWLQQRRLEEAHMLIREQGQRPSDVYLDVGFENLSHFSFVFKKRFGVSPSAL
jgi:AraC-like DNA-binding protein